ncbi:MAG: hypothetical protein QW272_09090 [Candidatus Methanomethylicaceae archaeon]
MKEKITLISIIISAIFLVASLYYGLFIKPKEITYTSFIPTTFSTTKSITETSISYITKTEKETRTIEKIYSTTKTETLTTTYRIIEEEVSIDVQKYVIGYDRGEEPVTYSYIAIGFIIINKGNYSILLDEDFIVAKGEVFSRKLESSLHVYQGDTHHICWYPSKEFILTPSNRSALFYIEYWIEHSEIAKIEHGKEKQGELFITYKIIETNQFKTFNFTFTYVIWKEE